MLTTALCLDLTQTLPFTGCGQSFHVVAAHTAFARQAVPQTALQDAWHKVVWCQRVALRAVRLAGVFIRDVCRGQFAKVCSAVGSEQVFGVRARLVTALVVNLISSRNWPDELFVSESVDGLQTGLPSADGLNHTVPAPSDVSLLDPAPCSGVAKNHRVKSVKNRFPWLAGNMWHPTNLTSILAGG